MWRVLWKDPGGEGHFTDVEASCAEDAAWAIASELGGAAGELIDVAEI
jgi:hypothetical protein